MAICGYRRYGSEPVRHGVVERQGEQYVSGRIFSTSPGLVAYQPTKARYYGSLEGTGLRRSFGASVGSTSGMGSASAATSRPQVIRRAPIVAVAAAEKGCDGVCYMFQFLLS
jgi:hypothetical protein